MNVIGIYPGKFQPPHKGNYSAYEYLKSITGNNTFISTDDVVDLPNSPLNFQDKQLIWTRHGVPTDKIVLTKDPQKALEITRKFGSDRTIAIFAMSKKEANKVLKNKYFLLFKGMSNDLESLDKHSYVLIIPDEILSFHQHITPHTIKQAFASKKISEEQKKYFFKQVFGWYDISLYDLIKKKFFEASLVRERITESSFPIFRRFLKPLVREILGQLSQPQSTINTLSNTDSVDQSSSESEAEKSIEKRKLQNQIDQKKKEADADLKNKKAQEKYFKQSLDKLHRFEIPNANKTLQNLKAGKI